MKDPRERHLVCRMDRYQLEDRYMRLLDEMQELKKLSNNQEDKIKKLATKLIRVSDSPKSCFNAVDLVDDNDKLTALETENAKLKEKVAVLRNQLLSHKFTKRFPSSGVRALPGLSSGATSCRSETSRLKVATCDCTRNEDSTRMQGWEDEKNSFIAKISELESILATYTTDSRREKVAENVEYIRLWRQLKQLNEKLDDAQNVNENLTDENLNLKKNLEDANMNNKELTAAVCADQKRLVELEERLLEKRKDSKESLHAKDNQIRDLLQEIKSLQQQNKDVVLLNSKLEVENTELKRKLSEQSMSHQSLKSAYSNDQANITALQSANEQLLGKLHELQRNIDILTMQLMTFQHEKAASDVQQVYKKFSTPTLSDHRDYLKFVTNENIQELECPKLCAMERGCQTSTNWNMREESSQTDINSGSQEPKLSTRAGERVPMKCGSDGRLDIFHGSNPLSRERILMLLEQAQINAPLGSQRFRQIDDIADIECSPISVCNGRQRQVTTIDKILLDEHGCF